MNDGTLERRGSLVDHRGAGRRRHWECLLTLAERWPGVGSAFSWIGKLPGDIPSRESGSVSISRSRPVSCSAFC